MKPFYTHQQIELPEIELVVTNYVLHKGWCKNCGKTVSAMLSKKQGLGYGPRLSGMIAELSGKSVQQFLSSVLGVISTGGIQKVIDRISEAARPAYDKIAETARIQVVGYVDETSWFKIGELQWLWMMVTSSLALYLVHSHRSREAFNELVKPWQGILVSDNFRVYQNWVNLNQQCLAHFCPQSPGAFRRLRQPGERFWRGNADVTTGTMSFCQGTTLKAKVEQLFYPIFTVSDAPWRFKNDADKLARSLISVMGSLWIFLDEQSVDPTNNRAERALRFGVILRKDALAARVTKEIGGLNEFSH
jgi:transposase